MYKFYKNLLVLSAVSLMVFSSCARDVEESGESIQRRILESYVRVNYGNDIKPTKSGMYIIQLEQGTGKALADSLYPFIKYSKIAISGEYLSSTYESISKQLGNYSEDGYYGPRIWRIGDKTLSPGVEELLKTMKVGAKARGIIPPWLLDVETGVEINGGSGSVNIFDIEVVQVEEDIFQYQYDHLKDFSNKNYGGIDTLEKGFFFKALDPKEEKDTLSNDTDVKVKYIGRYLDGRIFDTNDADTAKKYRIYDVNSSSKYDMMSVKYFKDFEKMQKEESNKYVKGFLKTIYNMKYGERAVGFFNSDFGYGAAGNMTGNIGIPEYTPLSFEIYIDLKPVKEEDKDDDKNDDKK